MSDMFDGGARAAESPAALLPSGALLPVGALLPAGVLLAPVVRVHGSGLSDARLDATFPPPRGAPV